MRLIDADALKEHLDYVCVGGGKWGDAEKAFINAFKDFVDGEITIQLELPSAELEEFEWCHDCKEYDQEAHCCHRWTKVIRNTVKELKAEWNGEWIPCSERLPEVGEDVLISYDGNTYEAHLRESKTYFLTHKIKALVSEWEVDAWMPLPEPWKGETEC